MEKQEKFYELNEDTIDVIEKLTSKLSLPFAINFKYIGDAKMKNAVKIQKVSDIYSHLTNYDILLFVNEDITNKLDAESIEILIYQELDRIEVDLQKGSIKIKKYPLQTTSGVLKKYGIDAVTKANELDVLTNEQNEDDTNIVSSSTLHHSTKVEFLDED